MKCSIKCGNMREEGEECCDRRSQPVKEIQGSSIEQQVGHAPRPSTEMGKTEIGILIACISVFTTLILGLSIINIVIAVVAMTVAVVREEKYAPLTLVMATIIIVFNIVFMVFYPWLLTLTYVPGQPFP